MRSRTTFLSHLASGADSLFGERCEQYGALCYRRTRSDVEFMVITSRDTRRWVIPKGWPIKGKAPHEVVANEAFEEAGVRGKVKKKALGYFTYLKRLDDGRGVLCSVQVHAMKVKGHIADFPEKGQRKVDWVSSSEAAARVSEPELRGLFHMLEQILGRDSQ